jgi:uncharacterized Zn finger protein (UPF0148 family)
MSNKITNLYTCDTSNYKEWHCPICELKVSDIKPKDLMFVKDGGSIFCPTCKKRFHFCELIKNYSHDSPMHYLDNGEED